MDGERWENREILFQDDLNNEVIGHLLCTIEATGEAKPSAIASHSITSLSIKFL